MKTLLMITLMLGSATLIIGQSTKEPGFLKLSFSIKDKNICVGESVDFAAKITNIGNSPIVIDKYMIEAAMYFDRFFDNGKEDEYGSLATGKLPSNPYTPDLIRLQPKESYSKNFKFVFTKERFEKTGKYRVQIAYEQIYDEKFENDEVWKGMVNSNKIFISLKQCK